MLPGKSFTVCSCLFTCPTSASFPSLFYQYASLGTNPTTISKAASSAVELAWFYCTKGKKKSRRLGTGMSAPGLSSESSPAQEHIGGRAWVGKPQDLMVSRNCRGSTAYWSSFTAWLKGLGRTQSEILLQFLSNTHPAIQARCWAFVNQNGTCSP